MSTEPSDIYLTLSQKERLLRIATLLGKDYSSVVDDLLSSVTLPESSKVILPSGSDEKASPSPKTAYDAFLAIGAIGCFVGPPDLSTNPKYMEGFGRRESGNNSD